ncbi:hypothetical protein FALBO_13525 [Fusarium albosuccineum]|uniref:Uncharacterized protein n=1 Tax=Fusarium albosuccineum TaxID=1237068 RepID=A0A8H4KZT6_9HYPO|nr:hypothetical protein FALBO_13525 [Fusarium albosuccineum]
MGTQDNRSEEEQLPNREIGDGLAKQSKVCKDAAGRVMRKDRVLARPVKHGMRSIKRHGLRQTAQQECPWMMLAAGNWCLSETVEWGGSIMALGQCNGHAWEHSAFRQMTEATSSQGSLTPDCPLVQAGGAAVFDSAAMSPWQHSQHSTAQDITSQQRAYCCTQVSGLTRHFCSFARKYRTHAPGRAAIGPVRAPSHLLGWSWAV